MSTPDRNTALGAQDEEPYHDESPSGGDETGTRRDYEFNIRSDAGDEDEGGSDSSPGERVPLLLASVENRVPKNLKIAWRNIVVWVKGPDPPRVWKIRPFFPDAQLAPVTFIERQFPAAWQRCALLIAFYALYLVVFIPVLNRSAFSADIPGYGSPVTIGCPAVFWGANNFCGIDGNNCRPFENSTLAFRCPANCKKTMTLNPHAVGNQSVLYAPLVIGGPRTEDENDPDFHPVDSAVYRADSFVCSAAIHAGFISNEKGGCGVLELAGYQENFEASERHGIPSVEFDSYFPMSIRFLRGTHAKCEDLRWPLLAVTLVFSIVLSLCTTSPGVFFWSEFVGLFFHVAIVSDPPNLASYYELVSLALGRFLPAAFCGYVVYRYCTVRALTNLTAQVEKTLLWVGGLWAGGLNNYTFDRIPIQRLTPHDIHQQPGAIPALITVVLSIFLIALGQAWCIRVEGRMPRYLALYGCFIAGLLFFLAVPGLNLRIHHYILALLLVPGTAMQTRPALLYQGLLVGLFINGIARWGFDSILQTADALRGDAQLGSKLPNITSVDVTPTNISFAWATPPDGYDGVSVLVNDVERVRAYEDLDRFEFTWDRHAPPDEPEYFRFGYLSGSVPGDFTHAGIWAANGSWIPMEGGPS